MSQLTSEELNYLIYRYLQEAGFVHSAFTFGQESFIVKSDIRPSVVPPGMLVCLVQKGLQYTSIEHHLEEDGSERDCGRPWSLLEPHVCEKTAVAPTERKVARKLTREPSVINVEDAIPPDASGELVNKPKKRKKETSPSSTNGNGQGSKQKKKQSMMDTTAPSQPMVERFLESEVVTLTGHQREVVSCAWSPDISSHLLASVAADDTGRVWNLPAGRIDPEAIIGREIILNQAHGEGETTEVTTLDWSPDGTKLVTGCYDGKATLWSKEGALLAQLQKFNGPLFALRWSPSGKLIAGAGIEHPAVIWDAEKPEEPVRFYGNHGSHTMDLDWRDDTFFATCTADKTIYIYSTLQEEPVYTLTGHEDEINSIRWSPDGEMLASCSDDATARIWRPFGEAAEPLILKGHKKDIYCLKWSPVKPGDGKPAVLATASFDNTVRIWDVATGTCLHTLSRHSDSVYAIAFSPDGRYLASGSLDDTLNVWAVESGSLARTYDSGRGGIFDISWSPDGERLAACTSDSTVCVFEFRP